MTMFGRLRLQLTFWYVGILALTLVAVGVVVYLLVARSIDQQVDDSLRNVNSQAAQVLSRQPPGEAGENGEGSERPGQSDEDDEYRNLLLAGQFGGEGDVSLLVLDAGRSVVSNPEGIDVSTLPLASLSPGDFENTSVSGHRVRLYTTTVVDEDAVPAGFVVTIKPLAHRDEDLRLLLVLLVLGGAGGLIVAGAGGLWVAQLAIGPVRRSFQRQREFVADASHELRTPLAVVRANAELLLARAKQADREPLEDIVAESALMGRLVSDLLTLARADRTELELQREHVDLLSILESAARGMQQPAAERGVALRVAGEPVELSADADRLRELLFVLLDNALRYTPAGGVVTVTARAAAKSAELVVEDTGAGIAKEHLPHVFERFYRVDKARSREEGGAGLGLAIAQAIVHAHGGTVEMTSEPGHGTRVTVTLPAGRAAQPTPRPAHESAPETTP